MTNQVVIERQLVDWSAAVWAGLIAGVVFLITNAIASSLVADSADVVLRLMASIVMGDAVLLNPPTAVSTIVGIIVHFIFSVVFACLIAIVIHRWGLIIGIIGGGLLGLALYGINFFALQPFFPEFYATIGIVMALSHILFGATAGGVYEMLEEEEFVEIPVS